MKSHASIFFDLDGTISDPREGIVRCIQYALYKLGHPMPLEEQLLRYIGPPLSEGFTAMLNSSDAALVSRAIELYRERFVSKGMFENSVYPGMSNLLTELHADHFPVYVVSTKPAVFARGILDHFGLAPYFRSIYGSEFDGSRSDKSELIAYVLEREQVNPSQTVMIGDREHDIKGAIENRVFPIGVLWGYGSRKELTNAGARILCDTPKSLAAHFQKLFNVEVPD